MRRQRFDELRALRDVSFDVGAGEVFGIVGRNGSGKSTLMKCLAGIYQADAGEMWLRGRMAPFIELGVGFNPDLTAHDNVLINAVMLGLTPDEARARYDVDHRLRRAARVRRAQAQELLVGHAGAPGVQRHGPRRRRPAAHRRGARRRRRRLPAEVLRRPAAGRATRAARSCSSRTTWTRSSASATARCCSSAATIVAIGEPRDGRAPLHAAELRRPGADPAEGDATARVRAGRGRPLGDGRVVVVDAWAQDLEGRTTVAAPARAVAVCDARALRARGRRPRLHVRPHRRAPPPGASSSHDRRRRRVLRRGLRAST